MALNIKDFATIVSDQVTALQGAYKGLVDLSIGSLLRSLVESNAGVVQWIQQLIVQLLVTTRAATCSGSDLDSWMADYGMYRLPAVAASGVVTFSRFTPTNQALIPVGSQVTTTDGTQAFIVTIDTTNPAYDSAQNGYVLAAGTTGITVPVLAVTAGIAGNVQSGTITVITGGIQYVDTVTNPSAFTNGEDAETDQAFRDRFVLWIASLSKATKAAIGYALTSMQSGVTYTLTENEDYTGAVKLGYFYVVVDDGSGTPTSDFLSAAYNAVDLVRAFTVKFNVFAPVVVMANVVMALTVDGSADKDTVIAMVESALQTYIASLQLGQSLPYSKLISVAYSASPYVLNVSNVELNGSTDDLTATAKQVIRAGVIKVV